jgi:hypothetical protein
VITRRDGVPQTRAAGLDDSARDAQGNCRAASQTTTSMECSPRVLATGRLPVTNARCRARGATIPLHTTKRTPRSLESSPRALHPPRTHISSCRRRLGIIPSMPTRKEPAHTYPTLTYAEANAWRDLHRQLARTRSLQDAKKVAARATPPHAKRFYAHLRSFVRTLKPPRRGTRSELYVYGKLRLRFAKAAGRRLVRG